MSFLNKLRHSRSSPTAILHKFLTNYDPTSRRIYAFVEGEPDRTYYRAFLEKYAQSPADIFVYTCDGKKHVYDAHQQIVKRYPQCRRVLFFTDKDVDDVVGVNWPTDPRIYTTDFYSIENHVICKEACAGFFEEFVKMRRVEVDLATIKDEFLDQRRALSACLLPLMAWIVAYRRRGGRLILTNFNLGILFGLNGTRIERKRVSAPVSMLLKATNAVGAPPSWREVRGVCRELKRYDARCYVRGHFEAWWFINFMKRVSEGVIVAVKERGGSVSIHSTLSENNFIQLLESYSTRPDSLLRFAQFHLGADVATITSKTPGLVAKIKALWN